ncbi:MAG: hypothetical protein SFV19_01480 [Rhodospirillaceae bacterium]|nr:hypothetical protein [Rhodospirillaceae bacterium]
MLKLFLDELGQDSSIASMKDRKRIQKAMYFGNLAVDLGYRYSWYLMGPYSTNLTRDYYDLSEALETDKIDKSLNDNVKAKLAQIKPLLTPPRGVDGVDWLETVASVHYLQKVSRLSEADARARFKQSKPQLDQYYDAGVQALRKFKLI